MHNVHVAAKIFDFSRHTLFWLLTIREMTYSFFLKLALLCNANLRKNWETTLTELMLKLSIWIVSVSKFPLSHHFTSPISNTAPHLCRRGLGLCPGDRPCPCPCPCARRGPSRHRGRLGHGPRLSDRRGPGHHRAATRHPGHGLCPCHGHLGEKHKYRRFCWLSNISTQVHSGDSPGWLNFFFLLEKFSLATSLLQFWSFHLLPGTYETC